MGEISERRLLRDSKPGDILLTEQVDRLSRLSDKDWDQLKREIKDREVKVVALDLPTSHMMLKSEDAFTGRMFDAINGMLLDMLAAIARKDYDDRRRRQAQGNKEGRGAHEGAAGGRRAQRGHHEHASEGPELEHHRESHKLFTLDACKAGQAPRRNGSRRRVTGRPYPHHGRGVGGQLVDPQTNGTANPSDTNTSPTSRPSAKRDPQLRP
ncbi:Resolvase, N terminal domain [Mesorhizobium sp. NFR06]|nr:Resolvase, N terminal domain [Mesorhizobium sp. NFR06]